MLILIHIVFLLKANKNAINLSDSLNQIFDQWPKTVELFLRNRMACPGCYLVEFDSLETALNIYDITTETFLEKLQEIIDENEVKFDD